MPLQPIDFPYYGYEQENPFLSQLSKGLSVGLEFPQKLQQQAIENALKNIELKYKPAMTQAELSLKQAQKTEAEALAGLHKEQAQTSATTREQETKKFNEIFPTLRPAAEAQIQNNNALAAYHQQEAKKLEYLSKTGYVTPQDQAQIDSHNAQAVYYKEQADKLQLENKILSDAIAKANQNLQSSGQQPAQPALYGVPEPVVTPEDIKNKMVYGFDSYTERQNKALAQRQTNLKEMKDSADETNQYLKGIDDQINKFYKYDQLMDMSWEAGPVMGKLTPSFMKFGTGKAINQLIADMSSFGMQDYRSAAGGAIRSIPEFENALRRKPDDQWSKQTRNDYIKTLLGTRDRIKEISQIKQTALNHPQLGLTKTDVDAIINKYEQDYPLVHDSGPKKGTINKDNLNHWREYFTPEAIEAIKNGKDFKPKSKQGNGEGIYWDFDESGNLVERKNK